ncbi:MAG: glycosyltransferase family 4 protein [Chromatiaceae bacterium]|nr:glycosyltransferase family 4 protein [Chromatiaceae bacterium]
MPRVLISTITPISGGVPTMTRFVVATLRDRGYEPVLAHYEPYSLSPQLSVPSYRLGRQRVGSERRQALDDCESHAIGAWLPELEFTHYWPTAAWRQVLTTCAAQVTVGGNALAAMPYVLTRQPFLAWVATGWDADRKDRVARFPWPCKLLDRLVNGPVLRRQERRILRSGTILALSDYTRRALNDIAGAPVTAAVLPMPVDTDFFTPRPAALVPGRIGFSGRLDDPRKNLDLLLAALAQANQTGAKLTALLIGSQSTPALAARIQALGLSEAVTFTGYLPRAELRDHLQTLDIFALPSHQEGLCIAALEAMACGCPVVATRCGGPEEFVIPGETGVTVGFAAAEMAAALTRLVADRPDRQHLAHGARRRVVHSYNPAAAEAVFWQAFHHTFPHLALAT